MSNLQAFKILALGSILISCSQASAIHAESLSGVWNCDYSTEDQSVSGEGKQTYTSDSRYTSEGIGSLWMSEGTESINWKYESGGTFSVQNIRLRQVEEVVNVSILPATGPIAAQTGLLEELEGMLLEEISTINKDGIVWKIESLSSNSFQLVDSENYVHANCKKELD